MTQRQIAQKIIEAMDRIPEEVAIMSEEHTMDQCQHCAKSWADHDYVTSACYPCAACGERWDEHEEPEPPPGCPAPEHTYTPRD